MNETEKATTGGVKLFDTTSGGLGSSLNQLFLADCRNRSRRKRFSAHRQPVQRAAVILPLQHAVATDLRAAEEPGDLGAQLRQGGGEARQRAGRQLRGRQRGQADMQRAAPLLIHFIDPHLRRGGARRVGTERSNSTRHPAKHPAARFTSNSSSAFSSFALNTMP